MIASVSSAAREKRGGFTSKRRRTCSWFAGLVRNWNPLATSSTRIPEESAGEFARRRRLRVGGGVRQLVDADRLPGRLRPRRRVGGRRRLTRRRRILLRCLFHFLSPGPQARC